MHTTLGDGRRKYPVIGSVRQKSADNTVSSDVAGGAVTVNTAERTFEIDIDTFRSTPGNEEAPEVMRNEVIAFLCKDQGRGQLFRAKRTGKVQTILEEQDVQTFTVMPDGVGLWFTDHLGRLFESVNSTAAPLRMGGELKGFELLGFSKETDSLIVAQRSDTTLSYCLYFDDDQSLRTLYQMPLEAYKIRSEALSPDGAKLYLEKGNIVLEIDLVEGGVRERDLNEAGPWKMMNLDLLASLDERFLLLQNEGRGKEVFLYDLQESEYYLHESSDNEPKVVEIALMGGESRYSRYDRRFLGEPGYGRAG